MKSDDVAYVLTPDVEPIPEGYTPNPREFLMRLYSAMDFSREAYCEMASDALEVVAYTVTSRRHDGRILVTRRLEQSGEKRLHGCRSIGVGGHVERRETGLSRHRQLWCLYAAERELGEELEVTHPSSDLHLHGTIYIPPTDPGDVNGDHIGLVYSVGVTDATIRETDKLAGEWHAPDELAGLGDWEPWSAALLPHVDEIVGGGA